MDYLSEHGKSLRQKFKTFLQAKYFVIALHSVKQFLFNIASHLEVRKNKNGGGGTVQVCSAFNNEFQAVYGWLNNTFASNFTLIKTYVNKKSIYVILIILAFVTFLSYISAKPKMKPVLWSEIISLPWSKRKFLSSTLTLIIIVLNPVMCTQKKNKT